MKKGMLFGLLHRETRATEKDEFATFSRFYFEKFPDFIELPEPSTD